MTGLGEMPHAAVYRRRVPGALIRAALTSDAKPLYVDFEVPDGIMLAEAESAAGQAMAQMQQDKILADRYGVTDRVFNDAEILALSRVLVAVETAIRLWKAWNYALIEGEGEVAQVVPQKLSPQAIAQLLIADQDIRAAWTIQLDAASPLERAEGNVSGVSPTMNSEEAPNIAQGAESSTIPAPADSLSETASPVPEPSISPALQRVSSPSGSRTGPGFGLGRGKRRKSSASPGETPPA